MVYSAILIPLMTILISQAIVFELGRFRFSREKTYLIFGIQVVVVVLISSLILGIGGLAMYAKWYVLIMVVPAFSLFLYMSKRRDARDIFTVVTTIFLNFIISIPSIWFARFYGKGYVCYSITRLILFFLMFFLIHRYFRKYYLQAQDIIDKGWGIFSILPILGSLNLYYSFVRFGNSGSILEALYVISMTIVFIASVYVVIFYIFLQLNEKYMVQEQRRILAIQNKAQLDQHTLFKDEAERSNRRWHDLRHNTQMLITLLESGDSTAALGYLKDQMGGGSWKKEEYCQHSAVNSILCLWADRARKEGIHMEVQVALADKLAIEPVELSALFANAIENAFIACLELSEESERFIKVEAHYNGKRLAMGISNTCSSDIRFEDGMPVSSKEGGGIGTRSMIYTVKRFKGTFSFTAKDGVFSACFVLNV